MRDALDTANGHCGHEHERGTARAGLGFGGAQSCRLLLGIPLVRAAGAAYEGGCRYASLVEGGESRRGGVRRGVIVAAVAGYGGVQRTWVMVHMACWLGWLGWLAGLPARQMVSAMAWVRRCWGLGVRCGYGWGCRGAAC